MVRPLRIEYSGAFYHLTSGANPRQKIFLDDEDRKDFLILLFEKSYEAGAKVYAFLTGNRKDSLIRHRART